MRNMNRHASQPEIKAAKKPVKSEDKGMEEADSSPEARTSAFSPKMGMSTIRNENCATASFLLPNSRPVAIVVPLRDNPGSTATLCARPITKASRKEISRLPLPK